MRLPNECVSCYCGIYHLPYAMRLVSGLVITFSVGVLTPLAIICHFSVLSDNHYLFIVAGVAALTVSIIVFLCLLVWAPLMVHFVLNIVWCLVTCGHIVSTMHMCIYYITVKPFIKETYPIPAVVFLVFWFLNMVLLGSGVLVYWSAFIYMWNDPYR